MTKVLPIVGARYSGKYIELAVRDEFEGSPRRWEFAVKSYEFFVEVEKAALEDRVLAHGVIGLRVVLDLSESNARIVALSTGPDQEAEGPDR